MHRPLSLSVSLIAAACALAACAPERSPDTVVPEQPIVKASEDRAGGEGSTTAQTDSQTRLTIYSGDYETLAGIDSAAPGMPGYALVERPLRYQLTAGSNAISATSVPPAMDVEAATLRPLEPGVTIAAQRFIAPLTGTRDVLEKAIGQRVSVDHTSGGAKQTDGGILVSANDGLALALNDGRIKVIRDYDSFSIIDSANLLPQQAALHWTVNAERAGETGFVLSYPMGGMAWRAEYLATLADVDADACTLSLDGAALVANRSGVTFADARLTLIAGEPNRVRSQGIASRGRAEGAFAQADAAAAPMPTQRTSGEYHAYDLPVTGRLANGATERMALFPRRPTIACERGYVVDANAPDWQPPQPMLDPGFRGSTGTLPVTAAVSFDNSEASGLGQPLPAGRVRVFDGSELLGESTLDHTSAGSEIRLEVGQAFDLSAERENTAFRVDRAGRTITESFAVTLRNAKTSDETVRVIEPLPRWSDWEIVTSSVPSEKADARSAQFDVVVPAGGETALTYTVRYRWAQDMNP